MAGTGPSLMGRNWLHKLKPALSVFHIRPDNDVQELLGRHEDLFKDELGLLKGCAVTIRVKASAKPSFYKPRTVPFALRGRVEQELDRLERMGVIEAVTFSEWAAPIVPIVKQDGSIRICGDYKLTINQVADLESYPLPRIDDLLASLGKGQLFSKLDLANAYLQLALDEDSKKFVSISTQKGLYRYNRLPFGVASAPAIFQRTMEGLLGDIPNVHVYLDDILVSGSTRREHLLTLEKVLSRLEQAGMRLKESKCRFMLPSVEYLGHHISADGIRPTEEKRRAIVNAPSPQDTTQLKSFLGLVTYYGKFLPHLADVLAPLYKLLSKHHPWHWGLEQEGG